MNYIKALKNHPLFYGIDKINIQILLECFHFQPKKYKKNEYIIMEGDKVQYIGIILQGTILMEKNDYYGNNYFFTELREHELFAEPFMSSSLQKSTVNYKAITNCSILIFPYKLIWKVCSKNCYFHSVFTENLMNLLALKTRILLAKIEILSKRSIRERLLTFLNMIRIGQDIIGLSHINKPENLKENELYIPLNYTEIAEYLCVNRSAFERELTKMKAENIISIKNNIFCLYI